MANEENFKVKEFCFVWCLEKLFHLLEHTDSVCSPAIQINSNSYIHFKLTLEKQQLLLSIKNERLKMVLNDCDLSFNCKQPNVFELKFSKTKDKNLPGWKFLCQSELSESRKKKLANSDLIIRCHFFLGDPTFPVSEIQCVQYIDSWKLSRDMEKLRECGSCSDLSLITNGDVFKVHRALLCVRSPELITGIGNNSFFSVEQFSAPVLGAILQYLYTGKVNQENLIILEGLLSALDALKLDKLKDKFCAFPREVEVVTKITQVQTTFTWPLSNISNLNLESPTLVKLSPWLCSSVSGQSQIELCLESITVEEGVYINVSVRWHFEHPLVKSSSVLSKTSVVDIFGELQHSYECEFLLDETDSLESNWKVVFSIKKSLLTRDCDILLPNDSLSLLFDFKTSTQSDDIIKNSYLTDSFSDIAFGKDDFYQLSADLKKLFLSSEYSDMTLRSGDKRFKVHKFILAARAPKLLDRLENRPLHEVRFTDIEDDVLEILLKYIYSAEIPELTCALAMKLYFAAYKYELALLKKKCLDMVQKKLIF